MATIPFVDVCLTKDNVDETIKTVLDVIKPDWKSDFSFNFLTKGFLNLTVLVCHSSAPNDAVVFKTIYEHYSGAIAASHRVCQFIDENELGPAILALFANGICMEYVAGENLDWETDRLQERAVWEKIAAEMARWHSSDLLRRARERNIRVVSAFQVDVARHWDDIMNKAPMKSHSAEYPTKERLLMEERLLLEDMLAKKELEPALCHMDVNAANIIINDQAGSGMVFVDYDFVGINYVETEIAWYFRSFTERASPGCPDVPGEEYEKNFIRHYLFHRRRIEHQDASEQAITDTEVTERYQRVRKTKLFITLRSIAISAVMESFDGGFDRYIPLAKQLWRNFEEEKQKLST